MLVHQRVIIYDSVFSSKPSHLGVPNFEVEMSRVTYGNGTKMLSALTIPWPGVAKCVLVSSMRFHGHPSHTGNLNPWIIPIQELAEFQQILIIPYLILKHGAFQMGLPPVIWKIGLSWIHVQKTIQLLGLQFFKSHLPGLDTRLPGAQRRCWPTGSQWGRY